MRALLLLAFAFSFTACATSPRYEAPDEIVAFQAAPLSLSRDMPTATPAPSVPAFQFTCGTTAARISPPTGGAGYREITIWNAACAAGVCETSDTPVFIGGVYDATGAVTTAVTTSTGMPLCNSSTTCIAPFATYHVPNVACIASEDTVVTVQVLK